MQFFRPGMYKNTNYEIEYDTTDLSDGSSDEEDENPLDIIDAIKNAQTKEEKLVLKQSLLGKFLDQRTPIVTSKMKDFLLEDGVLETLIGFLSRVDPSLPDKLEGTAVRPPITEATESAVKRSFRLMRIFAAPSKEFENVLSTKLPQILKEMFKIFNANSLGNFYHFKAILEQMLLSRPQDTTKAIIAHDLFISMFDYLHEPAVADSLLIFLCVDFRSQQDSIRFYGSLQESRILERLIGKLTNKGSKDYIVASELLLRMLDRLCSVEPAGVLFLSLAKNSKLIDRLFMTITSEETGITYDQKKACATVLREFLTRGNAANTAVTHELQRPMANILAPINDKLHEYAQSHIAALANEIAAVDRFAKHSESSPIVFSAFKIEKPFGFNKLILIEILSDLVSSVPKSLDAVPPVAWNVLTRWFLDYPQNNIYHCHFYRIFASAVLSNHETTLRAILQKYKFLSGIIKAYNDPTKIAARGFIIQTCNLLRLAADAQPSTGYLRTYLQSSDIWRAFVPTLRKETEIQRKTVVEPIRRFFRGSAEDDPGIDLGSTYAKSLGITVVSPPIEEPVVKEAFQKAEPSPKLAKKKKKNKKKKSKGSLEPAPNGNHIQETDEQSEQSGQSEQSEDSSNESSLASSDTDTPSPANQSPKKEILVQDPEDEQAEIKAQMGSLDWWDSMKKDLKTEDESQQ